jgi:hypothetical protein
MYDLGVAGDGPGRNHSKQDVRSYRYYRPLLLRSLQVAVFTFLSHIKFTGASGYSAQHFMPLSPDMA